MSLSEQFSQAKQPEQQTALGAARDGVVEGVSAFVKGIGKAFDLAQSPGIGDAWNQGRSEIAAALFNESAYVMYPRAEKNLQGGTNNPSPEVQSPEITPSQEQPHQEQHQEQSRGGRSM